jgi:hypothetical protein
MPSVSTLVAIGGVFGILAALTRRPLTAALLCLYGLVSVLIASAVMQSFLGMPLTMADVQFFFLDPLDDLKLFLNYPALGVSFLTIIGGAAALLILGLKLERVRWPGPATPLAHTLRFAIPAVLLLLLGRAYGRATQPTHGGTVDDREAWSAFLAMRRLELANHWVERLNVFFDNRDMLATVPAPHPQSRFPQPVAVSTALPDKQVELPDILMVLEESTFDPRLIASCRYPVCDSPSSGAGRPRRTAQSPCCWCIPPAVAPG